MLVSTFLQFIDFVFSKKVDIRLLARKVPGTGNMQLGILLAAEIEPVQKKGLVQCCSITVGVSHIDRHHDSAGVVRQLIAAGHHQ
ncbi:hypothetical protein EOPP23_07710 [Endozoicomonas sp. OPT23]|nr:hypothetical protein [Endozoicomonas sp. OPT23]